MDISKLLKMLLSNINDEQKISILRQNLSSIKIIKWNDIVDITSCFTDDENIINALRIIFYDGPTTTKLRSDSNTSSYFVQILNKINSNVEKIKAIQLMKHHVGKIDANIFSSIIKKMSNDEFKIESANILFTIVSDDILKIVSTTMPIIETDSYKLKLIEIISDNYDDLDGKHVAYFVEKIKSDAIKLFLIRHIKSDIIEYENIIKILRAIISDKIKRSALKYLSDFGIKINACQLLELVDCFTNSRNKYKCVEILTNNIYPIVNEELYKSLFHDMIPRHKYYIKTLQCLGFDIDYEPTKHVDKQDAITHPTYIFASTYPNNSILGINDGVSCTQSIINKSEIDGKITEVKHYSDGSEYHIVHQYVYHYQIPRK